MQPRALRPFLDAPRPLRFAHRGGAALFPENTLKAFEGSLALGIRYLETDVHMTRDGHIVAHHDDAVERTTNGQGRISDMTLGELRAFDAGYRFSPERGFPERGRGLFVPTFEELLLFDRSARINVELKQRFPSMIPRFLELLERHNALDRVLVAAEDHDIMTEFRHQSGGTVATSASRREATQFLLMVKSRTWRLGSFHFDALQVPLRTGPFRVITRRFCKVAHRCGVQVHAWVVDDEKTMRRLVRDGVDGIMTDRPDVLADAPL